MAEERREEKGQRDIQTAETGRQTVCAHVCVCVCLRKENYSEAEKSKEYWGFLRNCAGQYIMNYM